MTKNVSHISRRIVCPKCGTRNLRKSLSANNVGKEYFCDKEHIYFGISELVNQWNYDVADFYSEYDISNNVSTLSDDGLLQAWKYSIDRDRKRLALPKYNSLFYKNPPEEKIISTKWFDGNGTYSCDEPVWSSEIARDESYDVVNRMLAGIEELEWNFDVNDLPCPILQTGMC